MKLYHITRRENVGPILSRGLQPRVDYNLQAEGLSMEMSVINLAKRENLEDLYCAAFPDDDYVAIEVNTPRSSVRKVSHIEDWGFPMDWYIAEETIPPTRLRVRELGELF